MTHPDDLLADYVNGSLSTSERADVDAHLAGCHECSAEVSLARAARSALLDLPEIPVPDGISWRAVDAERRPRRPGWYRWAGAGAAAAVVGILLLTLPHLASTPASHGKQAETTFGGSDSTIGQSAASGSELIVQRTNYDQASLDQLTNAAFRQITSSATASAGLAPMAPSAQGRIGTSAELQTALACVGNAVAADAGDPFKLILARFDGRPSFLAFYPGEPGQAPTPPAVVVRIIDSHNCTASGVSNSTP